MFPVEFDYSNVILADDQDEYLPLPAYQDTERTVSKWKLTWRERLKIFLTGSLWLMQLNFQMPLQPQLPTVDDPFHEDS